MIDYFGYNLTEYKSFRQLQLEYTKLKNQYQQLQSQTTILAQNYQQKCKDLIQMKRQSLQQKIKFKNKNLKYKQLYRKLIQHIQSNLNSINKQNHNQSNQEVLNISTNDKSIFVHLEETENLQKICAKLSNMTKECIQIEEINHQLSRKVQHYQMLNKSQSLQKQKTQLIIIKQIQHLEAQLNQLNTTNAQLQAKINLKQKQKKKADFELKTLKTSCKQLEKKVSQLTREKQEQNQQNPEFALDFMTFQLRTLQTFFNKIIESTKFSSQMSNLLMIIYDDYEEISQVFREKLQIEYDLEELEQRYKSQKLSSPAQEHLLIQTRRQIETFRLQLLKQKQIFRQKQQFIEEHFGEYAKINEVEVKMRNYTYEVQNKLYKLKRNQIQTSQKPTICNPTARDILAKRNKIHTEFMKNQPEQQDIESEQEFINEKRTSVKFKQSSNAEEIMREIINKDKKNLEKILKETRRTSSQAYINK